MLKIIAGLEEPEEGTVTKANHVVVRYLPQNPVFDSEKTVCNSFSVIPQIASYLLSMLISLG